MPSPELPDKAMLTWATPRQKEFLAASHEHGSYAKAADALGVDASVISRSMARLKKLAYRQGYAPEHDMVHTAPETHLVKGTSTLYGDDGTVKAQWVKTNLKAEDLMRSVEEFAEALAESVEGRARPVRAPKHANEDLLAVYPVGDPHIGMLAWHEETGEDFDLGIARRDIAAAMQEATRAAPQAHTAVIVNLGDLLHADNQQNRTERAGNQLDVDGRYSKVILVAVEILVGLVEQALKRHQRVIIRNKKGNHDPHSSLWFPIVLRSYYRNEPRVEVVMEPTPFWYYRHGLTLLGTTHGHGPKPAQLAGVMAADRPQDWGETRFRYWLHGHIHSTTRHEFPGVVVESFRTLAGKDYWHTSEGYRAGRDLNAVIYHREFGEVSRHRIDITRVREVS